MKQRIDEATLDAAIRHRLSEIRACNNIMSVVVLRASDAGVVALVVPKDHVGGDDQWGMPTEPHLLTIPHRKH